ncbi:T9SS sorting signal type C domain-containing protein [Flavobacterium nackdongense]|uniref:T9SS sorting signal type C domain-containing protein n=1 Tax=Flavobacterium nackdongense TaxID=2547394 RepID=A0A4P6YGS9_9FLAO|nr:T9SS sorting signal type C domain-containing protein [Flavobacterium nackdongense]QBN19780.1 T9SS sorting signal type C domain-containing protein [Flavobacterium nackdongense]
MKHCNQILNRNYFLYLFLSVFAATFGQNALVGSDFASGWGGNCPNPSNAGFNYLGLTTGSGASGTYGLTKSVSPGLKYFRFGVEWGGTTSQLTITPGSDVDVIPNATYSLNTACTTNGAMKYNVPNASYNYVFKTLNAGTNPTGTFVFFEVQGAVRSITAVTQSPLASSVTECHSTTITATLDGDLAVGQAVYLRYTTNGYINSTVVKLTGSGTTFTGTIPSFINALGANVSYYLFTAGDSNVATNGTNADLYTINLNNNSGPNYSYTVISGGPTTAIPDLNFEQALIDLNLDCTLDNKVFTGNISSLTSLDISGKNISNLTGIEAFSSLKDLYCSGNLLTGSLNLSVLPNLRYIDLEDNDLTGLNITGLTDLVTLIVWKNNLTSLDLSTNTNMDYLDCDDNAFTSLDVSALTNLNQFYCSGNVLTGLDVRGLTNLVNFECAANSSLSCILVDNVDAATLKASTIDPLQSPSTYWTKDPAATYSYCDCSLITIWNGSSWDNGAPTNGTYAAIISGDYSQPANINACTLAVISGAIVTIPSGYNVTLNAPIIVASGSSFTLSSNANLIQTNKSSINLGNINVNRTSSSLFRLDYTLWSSPVAGTQTLAGFSPLTLSNRFYEYNTTSDVYNSVSNGISFGLAKGYLIRMPNSWVDYVASPPSIPASWTGTFSGTPNNGDITYTMSLAGNKYNAVGNPYPSALIMDNFILGNSSNISGPLYFWRKRNDATNSTSYSTCTTAGCTLNNGHPYANTDFISVGQGFIVKATKATLKFTNAMRIANTTNQFFKTKQIEKNRIWLNLLADTTPINQMLLAYMTGATMEIDPAIDGAYINDSPTALNSLIGNEEFAVQGRSLPFDGTDVVPLGFKTASDGNFTIAIDHVDGLFATAQDIYLFDNKTGIETNLKTSSYAFAATAGVDNTRFTLKYQKTLKVPASTTNNNSVWVYKNKGSLYVNSGAKAIYSIKVYDVQGRLLAEQKEVKSNTAVISNLKASNQVLIVQIRGDDNSEVTKKVAN